MDEVFSRATLPRETLRALSQRRDGPGLVRAAAHFGLLGILFALGVATTSLPLPGVVMGLVMGVVLLVGGPLWGLLFGPLHEAVHHTAFRTAWMNDVVHNVCSALHLFSPTSYRAFHWEHHRHTHDPERDPEISPAPTVLGTWPRSVLVHLFLVSGVHLLVLKLLLLVGQSAGATFVFDKHMPWLPKDRRSRVVWEARLILVLTIGVGVAGLRGSQPAILLVALQILGHAFLSPLLMAEHHGLPHSGDIVGRTRSIPTLAPLCWFFWNMPYHAEHHGWPSVPFHQLPALHAVVATSLPHRHQGYLAIHLAQHLGPPAPG